MPCLSISLSTDPACFCIPAIAHQSYSNRPRRALPVTCAAFSTTLPRTSEASSLYAVLDLPPTVSQAEIKSTYRKMARRYHPDVSLAVDKRGSVSKFIEVQEAYEILSDPERRAEYDYSLLHPFCAQALGRGFGSDMTMPRRVRRNTTGPEVSAAWKLQWEAQLSNLRRRQQFKSFAKKSWGEKMRRDDNS